jgi:hypothetical protein
MRLRSGIDVKSLGDGTPVRSELVGVETDLLMFSPLGGRRGSPPF